MVTSCSHKNTAMREKKDSLGRSVFALQCSDCLSRVDDWVPHGHRGTRGAKPWIGAVPTTHARDEVPERLRDVVTTMRLVAAEADAQEGVVEVARALVAGASRLDDLRRALGDLDRAAEARRTS